MTSPPLRYLRSASFRFLGFSHNYGEYWKAFWCVSSLQRAKNSGTSSLICFCSVSQRVTTPDPQQCDQVVPKCSQCVKSKRQCPGYRDRLDLIFRNENELVVRKARDRKAFDRPKMAIRPPTERARPSHPSAALEEEELSKSDAERLDSIEDTSVSDTRWSLSSIPQVTIAPSSKEYAVAFFFARYVSSHGQTLRGYFEYLPSSYSQIQQTEPLTSCITSVGLAGLSNIVQSKELMDEANREYSVALRSTNAALRSWSEATTDSTLISVMLLSLYETLTFEGQRSVNSWKEHLDGATMLLRLRGRQQFQTYTGLRIFQQLNSTILISCLHQAVPVPPDIIALRAYATNFFDSNALEWRLSNIMVRYINFLVEVKHGSLFTSLSILSSALQLDSELDSLSTNVPFGWQYQCIFTDADPELVYEGYYHVHNDRWTIHGWNILRTLRILLNQAIRDQLLRAEPHLPPLVTLPEHALQFQLSTENVVRLSSEICASLPQYAGYTDILSRLDFGSGETVSRAREKGTFTNRGYGTHFLVWPYFTVGTMTITPERQRLWIINRLQYIGRIGGTQQATRFAEMMR